MRLGGFDSGRVVRLVGQNVLENMVGLNRS